MTDEATTHKVVDLSEQYIEPNVIKDLLNGNKDVSVLRMAKSVLTYAAGKHTVSVSLIMRLMPHR